MDDLISKQAVLDAIDAYKYLDGNDAIYRLKQWLNKQESVQPKMGRWIMPQMDDGMSDPVVYQVRCSVCKWDVDPQIWYEDLAHGFCPNCGAKLGGDYNADSD